MYDLLSQCTHKLVICRGKKRVGKCKLGFAAVQPSPSPSVDCVLE